MGSFAGRLHHDANGAALGIGVFDSDGNALALFVEPQDYELPGFLLMCNAWRLDHESLDAGRQKLSVQDFEHVSSWLPTGRIVLDAEPGGCDMGHWRVRERSRSARASSAVCICHSAR